MRKSAIRIREHSDVRDNIVFFPPTYNQKIQRLEEAKFELNQRPHFFIVLLGLTLGSIFSLFIAYHIQPHVMSYLLLSTIPLILAYCLRRVYIYTLSQNLEI